MIAARRRPAVIRGASNETPWATWRSDLRAEVLTASPHTSLPLSAQLGTSATFGYVAQEGADHLLEYANSMWDLPTTLGGAVRRAMERQPHEPYLYASAPLRNLASLQERAVGWERLTVAEAEVGGLASLWLSGANVTTQCHYDVDHNVHVQLAGSKRWVLFPPQAASELSLFGFLHPRYRTSQVPFHSEPRTRPPSEWKLSPQEQLDFPRARHALERALTVELHAGDALYLPPFWPHHVTALAEPGEIVISLNVFSTSRAWEQLNAMDAVPLPFDEAWLAPRGASAEGRAEQHGGGRRAVLTAATRTWIELCLTSKGHSVAAFAGDLLRGGYPESERASSTLECGESAGDGWYGPPRRAAFTKRASELGAIASEIERVEGAAVARLAMMRHVEMVLFNFIGLRDAGAFLERCLPPRDG